MRPALCVDSAGRPSTAVRAARSAAAATATPSTTTTTAAATATAAAITSTARATAAAAATAVSHAVYAGAHGVGLRRATRIAL